MRVLFATMAEKSHILALAPMAWALSTAGHQVRVASAPAMTDTITSAGLTAVPVGEDHRMHEMLGEHGAAVENELADWSDPFTDRQTWESVLMKYQVSVPFALQPYNNTIVDGLVEYARAWQPDLVIWDPLTYAGPVAAEVVGAAHARLLWCVDLYSTMRSVFHELGSTQSPAMRQDPLGEWLTRLLEQHGRTFDESVVTGQWTLDQVPTSVQFDLEVDRVPVRYTPYNGPAVVPEWVHEPTDRPRVCLTAGASFSAALGEHFVPLREAVEALAEMDIELVATLDEKERAELPETLPDNVRIVDFVPMQVLLPTCAAVVHHAGYGTWSTAAFHGVPQYLFPIRHGDLWVRAEATERIGAGLFSHPKELTVDKLCTGVRRLIEEPEFAEGARKLQEEMRTVPTMNDAVAEIERRVEKFRVQRAPADQAN